ncbi:hypothetical protein ALT1000_360039 [Alteromonas macleodii]
MYHNVSLCLPPEPPNNGVEVTPFLSCRVLKYSLYRIKNNIPFREY